MDPSGQGLSATPEGTSESLSCGQRVITPEQLDSSFEIISDTDSGKRPNHRTAPAFQVPGTLGGEAMADLNHPPLGFDDLYTIVRTTPIANFEEAAANIRRTFRTVHDQNTLVALLMATTTARMAAATEIRDEAVHRVGDGQETPAAFLELIRHLDEIRHSHLRSD